jgi:hypothetical protein
MTGDEELIVRVDGDCRLGEHARRSETKQQAGNDKNPGGAHNVHGKGMLTQDVIVRGFRRP